MTMRVRPVDGIPTVAELQELRGMTEIEAIRARRRIELYFERANAPRPPRRPRPRLAKRRPVEDFVDEELAERVVYDLDESGRPLMVEGSRDAPRRGPVRATAVRWIPGSRRRCWRSSTGSKASSGRWRAPRRNSSASEPGTPRRRRSRAPTERPADPLHGVRPAVPEGPRLAAQDPQW